MKKKNNEQELRIFDRSLTFWILLALVAGLITGLLLKAMGENGFSNFLVGGVFFTGGKIFFASLQFLVVPVVFVSLVCGVGSMDNIGRMGRIGAKTMVLYVATTAVAIALALLTAILTRPGAGFALTTETNFAAKEAPSLAQVIIDFVPTNPLRAMTEGNMIQIIVLSLLFGVAISMSREPGRRVLGFFNDMNDIVMKMVTMVMVIAPIGVFCLIAEVFARQGFSAIVPLSKYFFTVIGVILIHFIFVYGGLLKILGGLSPLIFFRKFQEVIVFAFSTSSSNATLPVSLDAVEKQLGVKNTVASFTMPLGATINMDGTAIMQGVATVFIAQAYGIELSLTSFIMVILTATLASVGTAGVPGVGLITLAMVLRQVDLPVEGIGLIIGVDRLLDMTRTALNVTGDAVVTCVVAKSEKQLDESIYLAES